MVQQTAKQVTVEWTAQQLASSSVYIPCEPAPVVSFAAEELRRYLCRIIGRMLPLCSAVTVPPAAVAIAQNEPPVTLATGTPMPRGFRISPGPDTISVHAANPETVLQGIYRFLEGFGCIWSVLGRDQEFVPSRPADRFRFEELQCSPQFHTVAYCSDIVSWHYTQPDLYRERIAEDLDLLDWMAKTGATRFFFIRHPFDSKSVIEELAERCAQRGITVEVGGHILPTLLSREWFYQHPEYFPATHRGQRIDVGNLCASNPRARDIVGKGAVQFVSAAGHTAALHVWGADVLGGGWCRCNRCQKLTPQEQSVLVCNAVAEALEKEGLDTRVYYLAYHDTIEPRLRIEPHPRVWCEFAPRERCYGHAISDAQCGSNRYYHQGLLGYLEAFEKRVRVFEYYGDAILFFGCLVPIPEVIQQDVREYSKVGVAELSFLQFGRFSRWAYAPNFVSFAAATRGASTEVALEQLFARWNGDPRLLRRAFRNLEAVMCRLVRYGDIRIRPKRRAQRDELRAALATHLPQLGQVAESLAAGHTPSLQSLALLVRYTQTVLEGIAHELDSGGAAQAVFARALQILEAADRRFKGVWGEADLPVIHDLFNMAPFVAGWGGS